MAMNDAEPGMHTIKSTFTRPPISPPGSAALPPVSPAQETQPPTQTSRVRRRNRTINSCSECRRRKLACSRTAPCTNCIKFDRECLYLAPALDPTSRSKLNDIKDRIGSIEQTLTRDLLHSSTPVETTVGIKLEDSDQDDVDEQEDERDLEPGIFTQLDQAYDDDADDEIMDLGIQLGKVRVSERIGGFVVPNFATALGPLPELAHDATEANSQDHAGSASCPTTVPFEDAYPGMSQLAQPNQDMHPHYLFAGPDYLAPASDFLFAQGTDMSPLAAYLPHQVTCDRLMIRFWEAVHPVTTLVHRPTFEAQYAAFWHDIASGTDPRKSTQAVVFAALFMSAVTHSPNRALSTLGIAKPALVDRLKVGTEMALSRANLLRTAKLETMQAFVMYLVPLCRAEVSRAHSALTGMAIRLAECMGLHRDGTHYAFSAIEIHVRRLIWYHLCCLDIRTCEATGPRPQIKREDFDTKLPLNVEEQDLMMDPVPTQGRLHFTNMTLTRLRFECNEAHRVLWTDIAKVDAKVSKLGHVMNKIQKFRKRVEEEYMPLLRGPDPRQLLALHVYRILANRLIITLLHRYIFPDRKGVPDRLRSICIDACLGTNEHSISLDTRAELEPWSWYRGALQQYSSSLLLMFEVARDPYSPNAARIWKSLDYIFELPHDVTAERKIVTVLKTLQDRMAVFQSFRKVRPNPANAEAVKAMYHQPPPVETAAHVPEQLPGTDLASAFDSSLPPQSYSMPPMSAPQVSEPSSDTASPGPTSFNFMEDVDWSHYDLPGQDMGGTVAMSFETLAALGAQGDNMLLGSAITQPVGFGYQQEFLQHPI